MAYIILLTLSLFAAVHAGYVNVSPFYQQTPTIVTHPSPFTVTHKSSSPSENYDPHPRYVFQYGVQDKLTGDYKTHSEQRDGDVVHGEYSLVDADGYKRTVHYTADSLNGFQAQVHREPLQHAVTTLSASNQNLPIGLVHPVHGHHYTVPASIVKSYADPHYAQYASTHISPSVIYH